MIDEFDDRPLIIQSDGSVLIEVENRAFAVARNYLNLFAELVKSPEHIHTYRVSPISLWNAAASGLTPDNIIEFLSRYGKYETPQNVRRDIVDYMGRYGRLVLQKRGDDLILISDDEALISEIMSTERVAKYVGQKVGGLELLIPPKYRGDIKQALTRIGYPVKDIAGYVDGAFFELSLSSFTSDGAEFKLRDYQLLAAEAFHAKGSFEGGSGVVVLPCGAGKTVVGLAAMSMLKCETLVICTNIVAIRQWISEMFDKTNISSDDVGEYSGEKKNIKPITLTTYQMLTHRTDKDGEFRHYRIFDEKNWGLIIYDEVHLLPAPVFRMTAAIQAKRRLGLTATLVREDGLEADVFSLIGPKKFDVPWKDLENRGFIAEAQCMEIRVEMPRDIRRSYSLSDHQQKHRLAAENYRKLDIVNRLVAEHRGEQILIIGVYIRQLQEIADELKAPFLHGATPTVEREMLYEEFRTGKIKVLVVSKVANFAVDLPDASVAIQVSGTFGSRQEEAQRLGRILRPKSRGQRAHFYSIVSKDTREQEAAMNRQRFLTEQGYAYNIYDSHELLGY
ncbi:MAG: DEAD/DEAH box helicase [Candidatus Coatesbacteria bacterium]|nr:DEAD/DEAH box helicase [Candidatus Coatesbacteria bacterium]